MTRPPRLVPSLLAALALACAGAAPGAARAAGEVPGDVRAADALAAQAPGPARDRALTAWARSAGLADLVYVLRRAPEELGAAEAPLLSAALGRATANRADLRLRLRVRLAIADPKRAKKIAGELTEHLAGLGVRPYASPFRAAVLLPDSGDYAAYGGAVRAGFEAALALRAGSTDRPVEPVVLATAAGAPARLVAALDTANAWCGAVVGELLSVPTLALVSAARLTGLPVISPTATDEALGETGPGVLQIGPSGGERGAALARSLLSAGPKRVGALVSTAREGATLAPGFLAAAQALGATVAWSERYPDGSRDLRAPVKAMLAARVEVVVWDGDPREGDALFQELVRQRGSVIVCGGEALSPDRYHGESRRLLEGVRLVGEDWTLPAAEQAALDSVLLARGVNPDRGLVVRGWIAGTLLADAVAGGALSPAEIATALASRVTTEAAGAARRFLDGTRLGLTLPVSVIQRGRAVPVQ